MEEHNVRLKAVLEHAKKYNLRFSKGKLQLAKNKLQFLEHTVTKDGISADVNKLEAIKQLKSPTTTQD